MAEVLRDNDVRMEVNIGGLVCNNPIWAAGGPFKYGREYSRIFPLAELGAVVTKGTSLEPWLGNPGVRAVPTPSGMLATVGLQNPGIEHYLTHEAPWLCQQGTRVVVNLAAKSVEGYARVAERLSPACADAVEVNISCPNVKEGGAVFGTDPKKSFEVVAAVRRATSLPVIVKLSPNVTDITEIARAVEAGGADAVTVANCLTGIAIDVHRRKPVIDTLTGGLSGPATRPVIVRMVWQTAETVKIPVVACGGVVTWENALEFLLAGACAVQVGSGLFHDPLAPVNILHGLRGYLAQQGFRAVSAVIGLARR